MTTEFRMVWPGYTLTDYIKGRRERAKEIRAEAKIRADQIEQEMAALETATQPSSRAQSPVAPPVASIPTPFVQPETAQFAVQGMHQQARQGVTPVAETIAHPSGVRMND